jgi:hypothetical protein
VFGGWEATHIRPDLGEDRLGEDRLGEDRLGGNRVDARNRLEQFHRLRIGLQLCLTLLLDPRNGALEKIDVLEQAAEKGTVVGCDTALKRVLEVRDP